MMRRLAARRAALLASLTVLSLAASAQQMQTYRLSNANPSTLPSGSGTTSVVLTGTFPTFGSTYAVCFYNGTPTTPIVPDSATATSASITVPSSDFLVPGNASIYLAHATDSCTGTSSGLSNVLTFVVSAQQEYNISSASPGTIGAGSGDTLVTLSGNALVDLSGFQFAVCFYAGTTNTPITPSSADQYGATFTVPASTFQIAPSLFSSGQYNASIYVVPTYGTCNGTNPGISNSYTMPIDYPTLASDSLSALPINGVPGSAPTVFEIFGSNFSTTTQAAIAYNSSPASNVAGKAVGNGLVIPTPVVPAGTTSISINACNISGSYSYCSSSPLPIAPYTLASTTTTLAGTDVNAGQPAPLTATVTEGAPTPISTDSGPYLPGPPASTVTITEGTSTLGSGPLQVQNLSFIALGSRQINFLAGTDAVSTGPGSYDRSANSSPKIHALDSSTPITPVLNTPFTSLTADFNKDGLTDALFVQSGFGTMHLFLGTGPAGNLQFEQSLLFAQSCFSLSNVAVADFNGDGYPDIAYLCGDSGGGSEIYVAYNQGDGTFPPYATDIAPANGATLIAAADLDRNGTQDIVVAGPNGASEIGYGIQSFLNAAGNGTFTTGPVYGTAFNPGTQIVAKDLNNDGAADLVLLQVKGEATTIQTYQNNGSGTFTPAASFPVETSTSKIFVTTFTDTAAYPDIAVLEPGTGIAVALNGQTGDISFGSPVVTAMASITDAVPGDINADTLTDIVYNNGTDISVLYGLGDGTFALTSDTTYNTSFVANNIPIAGTSLVAATDLNNDGFADILAVVTDQSQEDSYLASTFLTTGNRSTLQIQPTLTAGTHNLTATYKGNIDLLGSSGSGTVTVNSPLITPILSLYSVPPQQNGFTTAPISPGSPYSFTFTILGRQGVPLPTGTMSVYSGDALLASTSTLTPGAANTSQGTISFGTQTVGNHNFTFSYSGDSNYSNESGTFIWFVTQATSASTSLAITSGGTAASTVASGSLITLTATVLSSTTPITPGQVLFCDANGASCSDIHLLGTAQLSSAGTASIQLIPAIGAHSYKAVFLGNTNYAANASAANAITVNGTYPTTTTLTQSGSSGDYTLTATTVGVGSSAAFSPNGTIPFVDTSNNNTVLGSATLGTATYAFGFSNSSNPAVRSETVATGDFNGDGRLDLVVASDSSAAITVLLGAGDGSFTASAPITLSGLQSGPIVVGDFNADGKLDLAIPTNNDNVVILLGNGDGTFTPGAAPSLPGQPATIVAGDFNGDGIQDLALSVTPSDQSPELVILLGVGDGSFTVSDNTPSIAYTTVSSLAVGDFNSDGKLDLAIASDYTGQANVLTVIFGNGDGTFIFPDSNPPSGNAPSHLVVADFNGDGKADIAATNQSTNTVSILLGNGTGSFTAGTTPAAGTDPFAATAGDFNGDGKVDIAVTNVSGGEPTILLGNGDGTFTTQSATGLASGYSFSLAAGDFNGDGQSDLAVPNLASLAILLAHSTQTATATATGINPTGSGTHQVVAQYPGDAYFHSSTSAPIALGGTTLTPVIHWATPAAIPYGTPLSATQLDAQATDASGNTLSGTYVYSPAAPTVLSAGTTTDTVIFTPTGAAAATYGQGTGSVSITVTPAPTSISLSASPNPIVAGQATSLSATVTSTPSSTVTGSVAFKDGGVLIANGTLVGGTATIPFSSTNLGAHTITATYAATTNFGASSGGPVTVTVNSNIPVITWVPSPATITYGTLVTASQLDATAATSTGATLLGNFVYNHHPGDLLTAGTQTLSVTFTPTNTAYTAITKTATITVNKANAPITWNPATPILTTTILGQSILDATSTIPGTFVYTPATGPNPGNPNFLPAGNDTLSTTFNPTDTTDYNTTTITTTVLVTKATPSIVLQVSPGGQTYSPTAQEQLSAFVDGTNLIPSGTLQFFDNGQPLSGPISGAFTSPGAANLFYGPFTVSPVTAGSHSYTATFSGDSIYNGTTSTPTPVAIGQITPILSWVAPAAIQYGTALTTTQLDAQAKDASGNAIPGLFTYTPALGFIPQAGSQTLSATFVPTDTASYLTPTTPITTLLQVNKAPQTILFTPPVTPATAGTSVNLVATGGASGHPVTFTVTSGPATVSGTNGSTLNYTGAGTVLVAANQASNTNYDAAPTVSNTVTVNAAHPSSYTAPSTPVGTTSATQTAFVNFATSGTLSSISVLTKGAPDLDFEFAGGTCSVGTPYTTGQTCSILYSFTPLSPGSRLGAIVLKDSSGVVLGTSYLQGIGTGPVGIFTSALPTLIIESLQGVRGLSTDGAGNLYALETTTGQIDKFAAGGANQTVLGKLGVTDGGATAVDGAGNLYVSAYDQSTIYELAGGAGTPVPVVTTVNSPDNNLVVDGAGNLYLTSGASSSIYKVAAGTHAVSTLYTANNQRFEGMGIDAAGNLYLADYNGNALLELPVGASTLTTLLTGQGLSSPSSVTLDPAGNIYVVNNSGSNTLPFGPNVLRFAAGTLTATSLPATGLLGITIDGSGNLFTVGSDSTISLYPRTTSQGLSFPATAVGTTSNSLQNAEFENDGTAPLLISSYLATPNFTTGSANTCAAGSFAAGATCTISAVFQPTTAGTLTGAINITDNTLAVPGTVQPVPLSGASGLGAKTITFPAPTSPVPAGTSATLTATTSNGDPVTYSILSGTAVINGSTVTFTTAGNVTIAANSPATSSYAAAAQVTRTVVVNQVTPVITWNPNPATIPYPTRLSAAQLNATASVPGTFAYSQPLNTLLGVGPHIITATFTPTNLTNYTTAVQTATVTVTQSALILSWTTPAPIPYGTMLSSTQLDAQAKDIAGNTVAGVFTYTPALNSTPKAGLQNLSSTFVPTDTADYATPTAPITSTLLVTQATPSLTWTAPASIVQGTPLSATQLNAIVTGISGANLPGTLTYTPAAGTRLQAGTTTLNVLFTPTDSVDYTTASGSVPIIVTIPNTTVVLTSNLNPSQSAQLVTLTATVAQTGTSTQPLTGTVTFLDTGKMIGSGTVTNGVATLPISTLSVGTHLLTATYNGSTSYAASISAPLTQSVGAATITISWTPTPSTIPYGTALALGAELDATASSASTPSVPGVFTYSPAAGAILTAGTQTLSTTFTPTDTVNFAAQTATRTLTVTQAKPTITWTPPAAITQGTPLSATQLDAVFKGVDGAILAGTVKYTPDFKTILPSGPSTLSVTFTPTDAVDYTTATLTVPITVNIPAATAVLSTTTNPTQYGQPTTLTTTVTPGGTLTAPPTGTVTFFDNGKSLGMATLSGGVATLPVSTLISGAHTITATYSGDTANAATNAIAITQTVTQATPVITWTPTANSIVYGTQLSAAQLNATAATPYFTTVPGAFNYPQQTQPILTAGTQTLTTTFTPTDTVNFATVTKTITLTVTQAKPTITWPAPSYTVVGTVLSGTQLDATAAGVTGTSLPGAFVYTPPAGTIVTSGMQSLSVLFTPTDTLDYTTATATVPLNGTPVTLTKLSSTTTTLGSAAQTITLTGTGFVSDSTARSNGAALTTTYVNATTLTAVLPASSFTTVQTLQITVFNPTQQQTSSALPFTVTAPPTSGTVTAPTTANPGDQPAVKFALNQTYPVDVNGTFTITFTPTIPGTTQDPALQFTNGHTTYSFVVPAGQTATPNILLQTGTISGTVTLTLTLEAGGITLPTTIPAATISLPEVVPGAPTVTLVRDGRNLTVNSVGFSNTRSVTTATFHFIPAAGKTLQTTDISIDVTALFAQWYSSAQSQTFGSSFLYSQLFTLDDDASVVGQVTVTLSNALGVSAVGSSQ